MRARRSSCLCAAQVLTGRGDPINPGWEGGIFFSFLDLNKNWCSPCVCAAYALPLCSSGVREPPFNQSSGSLSFLPATVIIPSLPRCY